MARQEVENRAVSETIAKELASALAAMMGADAGSITRTGGQVVLRPDSDHAIYIDVRAVTLEPESQLRRPARRSRLRLVKTASKTP
jgi:hypothetical protein